MPRPQNLKTKIFLDGGDPNETKQLIEKLGFLDGQTTNPTLIAKNPQVGEKLEKGEKFTTEQILNLYKQVVQEISQLIPNGSVSIEVYSDSKTTPEEMLKQGREMFSWIPNAHIKLPTTKSGIIAAQHLIDENIRVNMTLCFSQEQAAAIYVATVSYKTSTLSGFQNVFVSPFVGRLDDQGENGMDLIKNIIQMYGKGDGHVEVLTASVRNLDHLMYAISLGSDIITAPAKVLVEWAEKGMSLPDENYIYQLEKLKPIPYQELDLNQDWHNFDISHSLTTAGIERFANDWNGLIK